MKLIRLGELTINPNRSTVTIGSNEVSLEPKLFQLLMLFCESPAQIITRQQILDAIWANSVVTDNAVNKLVANLRKALQDDTKDPRYIKTVHKRGYLLVQQVRTEPVLEPVGSEQETHFAAAITNASEHQSVDEKSGKQTVLWGLVVSLAVLILLAWQAKQLTSPTNTLPEKMHIKALTKMPGLELSPLMSPEQDFIVYLREDAVTGHRSVWRKDLSSEQTYNLVGITPYISKIIAIENRQADWQLLYLAQENEQCLIATVKIRGDQAIEHNPPLLECTGMEIFDTAFAKTKQQLYYSAMRHHESKARIYQLDLKQKSHRLITQPEFVGMGNRGIDLSPNEQNLLIVQVGHDYRSQFHLVDLASNQLVAGLMAQQNLAQATWASDSKHLLYFSQFPSSQIIASDVHGSTQQIVVDMPDYIEPDFSRIEGSQDIIFSTINRDYNNRWIDKFGEAKQINNSTVYDTRPTMAHKSMNYAFISTRTGERQLFYGGLVNGNHRILARLKADRSLKTLSFSPDDKLLLTADKSHVWFINVQKQLSEQNAIDLSAETAAIATTGTLTSATWLNNNYLYYKIKENGQRKGYIYDRKLNDSLAVDKRWQDVFTDHQRANSLYMVDKNDARLYQIPIEQLEKSMTESSITFSPEMLRTTNRFLPEGYFDIKMHAGILYFLIRSNSGNAQRYDYQIASMPVSNTSESTFNVNGPGCSCGFDVADSGFIISELSAVEGDVFRATH